MTWVNIGSYDLLTRLGQRRWNFMIDVPLWKNISTNWIFSNILSNFIDHIWPCLTLFDLREQNFVIDVKVLSHSYYDFRIISVIYLNKMIFFENEPFCRNSLKSFDSKHAKTWPIIGIENLMDRCEIAWPRFLWGWRGPKCIIKYNFM